MSVHLHNPPRLLSDPLSNRKKWGKSKQHHILASNSLRASLTNQLPFPSLFPFLFPPPFTPFHHSTTHHHTRKSASAGSLSMQAKQSKQAKQAPMSFQKDLEIFLIGATQLTSHLFADNTYLQALRNKVFWSMRIDSYALLAARRAEGETFYTCMHVCEIRCTVKVLNRRKKVFVANIVVCMHDSSASKRASE